MKNLPTGYVLGCFALLAAAARAQTGGDALFAALNLARPEMTAVKDALDQNNAAAARHALAEYFRTRTSVRYEPDSPDDPPPNERRAADDALNHTFTVCNYTYTFDRNAPIDWKLNPTALPDSPRALNHEWTWQFNRMAFWPALAHTYRATGDQKYAKELTNEIRSWIAANPPPEKAENVPYSRWRTIEAGIRMFDTWPDVFFTLVADRAAFADDVLLAMVQSFAQHADYLDQYPTGGNWKTMESNGLFHVAVLFPEFKHAAKWRADAIQRQHEELSIQVYPDGTQTELAPGYHNVALKQFLGTLELAKLNQVDLPPDYAAALEKMFDVNLHLCLPDRTYANFNDSGRGDVREMLAWGLKLFPHRDDWRWIVTDGKQGRPPQELSHFFPQAGWTVMRSSWDRDALCLIMDAGPFGTGHQHEDKLSFILDAYGTHLVAEAGIFTYDASPMRRYSLGPAAHNTVFIDGRGQNRRAGPRSVQRADPSIPIRWTSNDHFDYAEASFGRHEAERWGKDRLTGFIHTRRILFVKPTYFIVLDTIAPPQGDTAPHTVDAIFHLDAAAARIDQRTSAVTTADAGRPALTILPLRTQDMTVRIIKGQTDPEMQGWISDHTYDQRPVPTPIFTRKSAGTIQMMYVFAPARTKEPPPILSITPDQHNANATLAATIELREAAPDQLTLLQDGSLRLQRRDKESFSSAAR